MFKQMLKIWNKQKLLLKLTTTILAVIIVTLLVMFFGMTAVFQNNYQKNFRENLVAVAQEVAHDPMVIQHTQQGKSTPTLLKYEDFMEENYELDYLVVFTANKTRLTHPNRKLIYKTYIGNNDYSGVLKGKTYSTIGNGTMGISVRAYAPIINPKTKEIIGAVGLGTMMDNYQTRLYEARLPFTLSLLAGSAIGFLLSALLAFLLKKQMHDMEPQQIGQVLEERNAMLNNIQDAIFVTHDSDIELMNHVAQTTFKVQVGDSLTEQIKALALFDQTASDEKGETTIIEHENRSYIVSVAPIIVQRAKLGKIYILRDTQELYNLTQQLYSTKMYAQLLVKQHHAYLNKLHVIYGLAHGQKYATLVSYLKELIQPNQFEFEHIIFFVHSQEIAGTLLLMEKTYREKEIPLEVRVLGEIPEIEDARIKSAWIDYMQRINQLLQKEALQEITFEMEYSEDALFSQFTISGPIPTTLQEELHHLSNYDVVVKDTSVIILFEINFEDWRKQDVSSLND